MPDFLSAHVTHHWVDIEELELFTSREASSLLQSVRELPGVEEAAVLKTCNRVEVYTVAGDLPAALEGLRSLTRGSLPGELNEAVRFQENENTLHHLLRVASGLDSMIVGEDQILGQVKEAYEFALKHGSLGKNLDVVFRKAITTGKRVRTETGVNKGAVSLGSAAVKLAEKLLGNMEGKTILVLGAGEMAGLVAKALAGKRLRAIFVANRTHWRAAELARKLNGIAITFEELPSYVPISDVIICATGAPHVVLSEDELRRLLGGNPRSDKLLIIDLGNPRNVDGGVVRIPNVELRNIDGLREIAQENYEKRRREVAAAEAIVREELGDLVRYLEQGRAEAIARNLYRRAAAYQEEELAVLLRRAPSLEGPDAEKVREFAQALVKRLLADPTEAVREASRAGDLQTLRAAARLFRLEEE